MWDAEFDSSNLHFRNYARKNARYPRVRVPARSSLYSGNDQTDSRRFVPPRLAPAVLAHPGPPSGLRRTPTFSSTVWCGMDVVKLPRGHRPLSPVPSATGHGHCPLVYPRGIRRTTREDESRALWVNTHRTKSTSSCVSCVLYREGIRVRPSPCKVLSCHDCYHEARGKYGKWTT